MLVTNFSLPLRKPFRSCFFSWNTRCMSKRTTNQFIAHHAVVPHPHFESVLNPLKSSRCSCSEDEVAEEYGTPLPGDRWGLQLRSCDSEAGETTRIKDFKTFSSKGFGFILDSPSWIELIESRYHGIVELMWWYHMAEAPTGFCWWRLQTVHFSDSLDFPGLSIGECKDAPHHQDEITSLGSGIRGSR